MNPKAYTEANRIAWNQVAPYHREHSHERLREGFSHPGFNTLDEIATDVLRTFSLENWNVAQLCCNNGRELLSILNLGAATGVGFDISNEFISDAWEYTHISGLPAKFVCCDVYDIGWEYEHTFDLVYISIGALTWLPDLDRFLTIVSFIMKPGGHLLIYEQHPLTYSLGMPGDTGYREDAPFEPLYDYFREDAMVFNEGLDYLGGQTYESEPKYEFAVRMSDLINAIIRNGIDIMELNEYRHDISNCFKYLGPNPPIPLSFMLLAHKREEPAQDR
jgi:SAM-dependent methyltransferase